MGSFWSGVRKTLGLEEDQLQQLKKKTETESEVAQELGDETAQQFSVGDAAGNKLGAAAAGTGAAAGLAQTAETDVEAAGEFDPFTGFGGYGQQQGYGEQYGWQPQQQAGYQWAPEDGVLVAPTPMTEGEQVTVKYSGLLAQNGAQQVFLHWGYGPGAWRDVKDQPMERVGENTFTTACELANAGRLEFCFRDAVYNWDNNRGKNWSYEIHSGRIYS